jgi:uncharacterized coiled-coil DUF342 family protein
LSVESVGAREVDPMASFDKAVEDLQKAVEKFGKARKKEDDLQRQYDQLGISIAETDDPIPDSVRESFRDLVASLAAAKRERKQAEKELRDALNAFFRELNKLMFP